MMGAILCRPVRHSKCALPDDLEQRLDQNTAITADDASGLVFQLAAARLLLCRGRRSRVIGLQQGMKDDEQRHLARNDVVGRLHCRT